MREDMKKSLNLIKIYQSLDIIETYSKILLKKTHDD